MGGLSEYDYELPAELIAQIPAERRDESRLLVLERTTGRIEHGKFRDVLRYLQPGDLLVLNETKVFPARLRARRPSGREIEVLLLAPDGTSGAWSALARPARVFKPGTELELPRGAKIRALSREGDRVVVEISKGGDRLDPERVIGLCDEIGEVPLPPYIARAPGEGRNPRDLERYQTVYARNVGSVAAPTAGLHFTEELLEEIRRAGVEIASVTLHVGYATFKPLDEKTFAGSRLHEEWVEVERPAGEAILNAVRAGRRTIAVGTTSVRAVESFLASGKLPFQGTTDLFIKPGYRFLGVRALITNFHLPRSSLLLLVSAFAGRDLVLRAYREAVERRYRFYSYGDAMLII